MKQPCVILELVCTFCVFSISFGQQQLGSADGDSITEVLPGTSEIHHPVVKCVAKSDEENIVTVSILESGSQENIVSLNIHTNICVTTVNVKARIECQVQDPIYEIYAEIQNLAVGEKRNYTCRKTYFDGSFSHKDEQRSLAARELDQASSERMVVILLAVFLAVTLCLLIGSAVGFFVWRRNQDPPMKLLLILHGVFMTAMKAQRVVNMRLPRCQILLKYILTDMCHLNRPSSQMSSGTALQQTQATEEVQARKWRFNRKKEAVIKNPWCPFPLGIQATSDRTYHMTDDSACISCETQGWVQGL